MSINKFTIVDDEHILIHNVIYKCIFIDENTINIESRLLGAAIYKEVIEFLSNKNIVIDKCEELDLNIASNVENSNITVNVVKLHYQSNYFKYYPKDRVLKERTGVLDCVFKNGTKLTVKGYYLYTGLEWSMYPDALQDAVVNIENGTDNRKIKLIHSNKSIDMEEDLKKCFDY